MLAFINTMCVDLLLEPIKLRGTETETALINTVRMCVVRILH